MAFLRTCAFLALMVAAASAAPPQNTTTTTYELGLGLEATVGAEPRGRGTFGIVFSCTATFAFCVWTAVHTNIIAGGSVWNRFLYKAVMMIVSVIVPEGIIMCAFGQWREARKLQKAWNKKHPPKPTSWFGWLKFWGDSDEPFGMDVAFFVVMGGFVIDKSDKPGSSEPFWATLTHAGFLKYLEEGYIDQTTFDRRSIIDKGKTSNIAKLLASVQAIWLLAQCLSRWISDLKLTLLEVHVAIQVLGTMIIYACWWSKPLDVNDPIHIILQKSGKEPLGSPIKPLQNEGLQKHEDESKTYSRENPFITKQRPQNWIAIIAKACYDIVMYIDAVAETVPGDPEGGARKKKKAAWVGMFAEATLVLVIGVLHAAAWNFHFPTVAEAWVWRVSSLGMCVFPMAVVFIATCTGYQKDLIEVIWKMQFGERGIIMLVIDVFIEIHRICKKYAQGVTVIFFYPLHFCLIWVCLYLLGWYALCALFILVESYASMRSPPDNAFLTPVWSDYWPHL